MGTKGNFYLGQTVQHRLYGYRGVVVDVDPEFNMSDIWYEEMAKSRPDRQRPWCRVLVHNTCYETYESEENLVPEMEPDKINHPDLRLYFKGYANGRYHPTNKIN